MIRLTRLHGGRFLLNEDRIERIEERPDTTITTVDGNCYPVAESVAEVVQAVRESKAAVMALARVIDPEPTRPGRLRLIEDVEGGEGAP